MKQFFFEIFHWHTSYVLLGIILLVEAPPNLLFCYSVNSQILLLGIILLVEAPLNILFGYGVNLQITLGMNFPFRKQG